ncbi:ATP-dependent 6-phosphofructokinase [Thalassotalea hakodatensis]|uniref:ATP-dependent 6-phosphofructokinase n=1 Tax=Thalassotalea hakodatensis TaxID=3030492 RepID=UPI0025736B94|nr:ATP-dependent 6-phosphofructokinase [Thalassotalea hakodatensis]
MSAINKQKSNTIHVGLLTSGGDAPGMNAAIRAVVLAAAANNINVTGFHHGYNGLIDNECSLLSLDDVQGIIRLGGTILKSARCKAMTEKSGVDKAVDTLKQNKIDALIVIGGDGSFCGLQAIQKHWQGQTIGIPGTIDNDIDGTDYTIGFSTAVNTAIDAIDKIRDTANAFDRVFIVELMGRKSGHITFNVGISCAAEQVISFENFHPSEKRLTLNKLADNIQQSIVVNQASYLIVMAENLWPGGSQVFADELSALSGVDCTLCTLGYIQRGGSPVAKDRILATKMGVAAIQAIMQQQTEVMIGEQNNAMVSIPLTQTTLHQKQVSQSLVDAQQNILAMTAQTDT